MRQLVFLAPIIQQGALIDNALTAGIAFKTKGEVEKNAACPLLDMPPVLLLFLSDTWCEMMAGGPLFAQGGSQSALYRAAGL
jgi:hypothetical protein